MNEYQFEPYEKVLVRDHCSRNWYATLFSHRDDNNHDYPYCCIGGRYAYCIPFKGNEHLINTNADPKPIFRPKKGQLVAVSDDPDCGWEVHKYVEYRSNCYWCVTHNADVNDKDRYASWAYCEPLEEHFDIGD